MSIARGVRNIVRLYQFDRSQFFPSTDEKTGLHNMSFLPDYDWNDVMRGRAVEGMYEIIRGWPGR